MDVIAATKLAEFLSPKGRGDRVNTHVVKLPSEPKPDFEAMQKVVHGQPVAEPVGPTNDEARREVLPKND